eukprot:g4973.t1
MARLQTLLSDQEAFVKERKTQEGGGGGGVHQSDKGKPTLPSVIVPVVETVDETEVERAPYHKYVKLTFCEIVFSTLYRAAMEGRTNAAEEVIRDMIALGIQPGPKAYHALIFAYAKSGNSSGALNAIRRAHASGLNPLTESYLVLIHTFMKENNPTKAKSVFRSMTRPDANVNIQAGWNTLTSLLFQTGSAVDARTLLEEGRNEDFLLDNKLYTESIKQHCQQGQIELALEDLSEVLIYEMYDERGLHPIAEQIEPLLECVASTTSGQLLMMLWLLQLPQKVTSSCYYKALRAIINQWDSGNQYSSDIFNFVWEELLKNNDLVDRDLESTVLYLMAEIKRGNVMDAQRIFIQEQLADVDGYQKKKLVSEVLSQLLVALSSQGLPIAMHNLLLILSITNMRVPDEAFIPDSKGRTFVTQWLDGRLENVLAEVDNDEVNQQEKVTFTPDGRRIVIVDGVKIGFGNCVVDDDGRIVPLSGLRIFELRAECKMRGLDHEANKKVMYEAVKLARRAMPTIKDEIKRKKQLTRKKEKMTGIKSKSATSKKNKQEDETETYYRIQYRHGKLIKKEILSPQETEQLFAKPEPKTSSENSYEMDDEEAAIEALRIEDGAQTPKWSDIFTLTSRQNSDLGTDQTACANAVVSITALIRKLGGTPTLEDFEAMLYIIDQTRNPAAAWKLGNLITREKFNFKTEHMDATERDEEYQTRLCRIMHACARICLTCGFPDSCDQLVTKMKELEIDPDPVLLQEIEQFREKGATELEGKFPSKELEMEPESTQMVPLVIDPLRPIRRETPLKEEVELDDDKEESEIERPTDMFPSTKSDDEEESLVGFGGLDRLGTESDKNTELDDDELLTNTEI